MNPIYSESQLKEIDIFLKLLVDSSSGILSLQSITEQEQYRNLNFSLFVEINKTYNLFTSTNPFGSPHFSITTQGRESAKIGFETYTKNIEKDKNKPIKHSRIAILISILAALIAITTPLFQYYTNKPTISKSQNDNTNNPQNKTIINGSIMTEKERNPIRTISDSLVNDTNFINKISKKLKSKN
jgi:hypothetical protein